MQSENWYRSIPYDICWKTLSYILEPKQFVWRKLRTFFFTNPTFWLYHNINYFKMNLKMQNQLDYWAKNSCKQSINLTKRY